MPGPVWLGQLPSARLPQASLRTRLQSWCMTFLSDLSWGSMTLVQLEDQAVGALGRVTPRLLLTMQANSTDPGLVGRMLALRVDVTFKNELLGWGEVPASQHEIRSQRSGSLPSLEVPLTPAALAFLQDEVRDDDLSLTLAFNGLFHVTEAPATLRMVSVGSILPLSGRGSLTVPHSDWVKKILAPLGVGDYMLMVLHVPPPSADGGLRSALRHLRAAEAFYADGKDGAVLQSCHAAFESFPGWPKAIFDKLPNQEKGEFLDKLLKESKGFMNAGRHVVQDGGLAGEFDVEHRDSLFALALTKVWLTYLSRLA